MIRCGDEWNGMLGTGIMPAPASSLQASSPRTASGQRNKTRDPRTRRIHSARVLLARATGERELARLCRPKNLLWPITTAAHYIQVVRQQQMHSSVLVPTPRSCRSGCASQSFVNARKVARVTDISLPLLGTKVPVFAGTWLIQVPMAWRPIAHNMPCHTVQTARTDVHPTHYKLFPTPPGNTSRITKNENKTTHDSRYFLLFFRCFLPYSIFNRCLQRTSGGMPPTQPLREK